MAALSKVTQTAIGVGLSVGTSVIYEMVTNGRPIEGIHHYHVGLLSLIAGERHKGIRYFAYGFGGGMIAADTAQWPPFDLAQPNQQGAAALTAILGGFLLVVHGCKACKD